MQDADLLRYSRHILLDELGVEGQTRLSKAHALVIGAGGLGSPASMYLACAGVGHITLVDQDTVDLTNLQRQIVHNSKRIGQPKVLSAVQTLRALNPQVELTALALRAGATELEHLVRDVDVVLDCCDNFSTRHAINAACVRHKKPLVSGAAIAFDGQISVYDVRNFDSPCYACAFAEDMQIQEVRCSTMGVFAPLVGIIGSMQAAEALKLLAHVGQTLTGRLLMLDARTMKWQTIHISRTYDCAVCATR